MKMLKGDIWNVDEKAVVGIPTNGYITQNGLGVMGRGVALEAREKFPFIQKNLGDHLKRHGNCVGLIYSKPTILCIPVKPISILIDSTSKYHQILPHVRKRYKAGEVVPGYHCLADPVLIEKSLKELNQISEENEGVKFLIPLLGCGNGGLDPKKDLWPILKRVNLPDSITLVIKR